MITEYMPGDVLLLFLNMSKYLALSEHQWSYAQLMWHSSSSAGKAAYLSFGLSLLSVLLQWYPMFPKISVIQ